MILEGIDKNTISLSEEIKAVDNLIISMIEKRKLLGVSQMELEKITGIKQPAIARIEALRNIPKVDTLIRLSKPLGLLLKFGENENVVGELLQELKNRLEAAKKSAEIPYQNDYDQGTRDGEVSMLKEIIELVKKSRMR